jgi:hypothetical protein
MPVRLTVWGLPVELSVIVTEAVRVPVAVGAKVTLMVQLPPAGTEVPQVLVTAKSPGLGPVGAITIPLMVSAALPWLVRVTGCTALIVPKVWLPKFRLVGVRLADGALPVPLRFTVWGLPAALSAMLSTAVRAPRAAGVKVTVIVQLPPAATELPHVLVTAKSPGFAPVAPILVIVKLAFPVLVRVTACGGALVPTAKLPNVRVVMERLTCEVVPVPERLTVWGLLAALSVMVSAALSAVANVGVNATLIVQLFPVATEPAQSSVSPKSPAFAPVTAMAVVKVEFPVLVRMTGKAPLVVPSDWLPKVKLVVERPATAAVPTPVPVRDIICGLPLALSVTATEAARLPAALGVNVTEIVQVPAAATEAPQLLVAVKSPGLAPVTAIPAMVNDALPVLSRVTDCAALVAPMF